MRCSKSKQNERAQKIQALTQCHGPLTSFDREVIGKPIEELVQDVHNNVLQPIDILRTYGRVALRAHEKTNCLTEIMVPEAEKWVQDGTSINLKGPLAGIPVSLKDTIHVGGFDSTVGFSSFVGNKEAEDGATVRLLKDAGGTDLVTAVRKAVHGVGIFDPRVGERASSHLKARLYDTGLTRREYDVVRQAAAGLTTPEIAAQLGLTRHTTAGYLRNAMRKLGARNRIQLITKASQSGLL